MVVLSQNTVIRMLYIISTCNGKYRHVLIITTLSSRRRRMSTSRSLVMMIKASRLRNIKTRVDLAICKATATLGGIARGNDRGIAYVVWQVTLKYMGALIGRQCRCHCRRHCRRHDSGNDGGKKMTVAVTA